MNSQLVLVFSCLILGILLKRTGRFPPSAHLAFNAFVIWVALPCLVLVQIQALFLSTNLNFDLLLPISMAWILFGCSIGFFYLLGKKLNWESSRTGAVMLTAGLGNTSFVGFPILEWLHGPKALPIGILVDQPGSFLVLSTLGIFVASSMSPTHRHAFHLKNSLLKVVSFPPFLALALAIVMGVRGLHWPSDFVPVLERLSNLLVPLALTSVGFQLQISKELLKRQWQPLAWGLTFKLVLSPVIFSILYIFVLSSHSFSTRITILESAMATMITATVVSDEFGFDAELSKLMLGVGIPLSLLTVYLWDQVLNQLI